MINTRLLLAASLSLLTLVGCAGMQAPGGKRELMIVGNDEKQSWDDSGKPVIGAPGKDSLSIIDIGTDPLAPKIIANLPLDNTIVGPPVNLAITPDESLALVANSINVVEQDGVRKQVPDNRLFVIDLTTNPPKLIHTVAVGKQPSGMSINRAGNLALIANRADGSISVLRITGKKVELIDTVVIGEQVAHVRFTPDGRRALAAKFPGHKIAMLDVNGEKVSYNKFDMPVGLWPYNVDVTPDGKLALTADNGNAGAADGNVDTVSVIDLDANPPRVIDRVVVGDGPEGLAISPTGKLAVAVLLRGTNAAKNAVLLQPQRPCRRTEDRWQEGHSQQRGRGARIARGRRVQPGWTLPLYREFHRPGHFHSARGRRPDREHGQVVSAGVILTHCAEVKVTHLGEDDGFLRPSMLTRRKQWRYE